MTTSCKTQNKVSLFKAGLQFLNIGGSEVVMSFYSATYINPKLFSPTFYIGKFFLFLIRTHPCLNGTHHWHLAEIIFWHKLPCSGNLCGYMLSKQIMVATKAKECDFKPKIPTSFPASLIFLPLSLLGAGKRETLGTRLLKYKVAVITVFSLNLTPTKCKLMD